MRKRVIRVAGNAQYPVFLAIHPHPNAALRPAAKTLGHRDNLPGIL